MIFPVLAHVAQAHQALEMKIKDPLGKPIVGASLELSSPRLLTSLKSASDANGRCHAIVNAGSYQLQLRHPNFRTITRRIQIDGNPLNMVITMYPLASATVVVEANTSVVNLSQLDEPLNHLVGIADAANEGIITPADLKTRPYQRPGDLLETVPGLLISQHSGEGKANQYYLRGFNLDHGTDVAVRVAGMPINLPSNAHGQGYLDLNFLIPELVSRVQYRKGPAFVEEGDFSAAGSVDIGYLHALERPLLDIEAGAYSYRRALFAGSWKILSGDALVAQESIYNEGPWDHPAGFRKHNTVVRWSQAEGKRQISATVMVYGANWDATDQIPKRAVDPGVLSRFGTIDPTDGGQSERESVSFEFQDHHGDIGDRLNAYWVGTRLKLWSNFSGWLNDPIHGDQFQQTERRNYGGLDGSRAFDYHLFDRPAEVRIGFQARWDNIPSIGLSHTIRRDQIRTIREDQVLESTWAPFIQFKIQPLNWMRATISARHDSYSFEVNSNLQENSGKTSAAITSPKLSLAFGPWGETEFYVATGRSFHSNDARGTTLHVDPQTSNPATPVTPLVRAMGSEVGLRSSAVPWWQWTLSFWRLDLASELVFSGDAGITEPSRPSLRQGVEWANTVQLTSWAGLEGDLAYSKARFTVFDPAGDRIPGAVEGVGSLSLHLHPSKGLEVTVGFRYFGSRPLIEDNSVRSNASLLSQAKVSWEPSPGWRLTLEAFNLTNNQVSDIDYYYTSRLPGEPLQGVSDIHFHPVEPRNLRFGVAWRF